MQKFTLGTIAAACIACALSSPVMARPARPMFRSPIVTRFRAPENFSTNNDVMRRVVDGDVNFLFNHSHPAESHNEDPAVPVPQQPPPMGRVQAVQPPVPQQQPSPVLTPLPPGLGATCTSDLCAGVQ